MNIGILTFQSEKKNLTFSVQNIVRRGEELGHKMTVLYSKKVQVCYGDDQVICYEGKPLENFDAIIVRSAFTQNPSLHASLIREFELQGHLVINGHIGVHRAKNKIRTLQLLNHFNIPMPRTVVLYSAEQLKPALKGFSFPVVIKAAFGLGGNGIFIGETRRSASAIVDYLLGEHGKGTPIKIQEYIKESKGKDLRVFVVGKKVVAAMQRSAKRGDFRSNYHAGGSVNNIEITDEERDLAIQSARHIGLNIAGVDILRSKKGAVVIEVNSNPGLEGIMNATGIDVPEKIIKYVERKIKKRRNKNMPRECASNKQEA